MAGLAIIPRIPHTVLLICGCALLVIATMAHAAQPTMKELIAVVSHDCGAIESAHASTVGGSRQQARHQKLHEALFEGPWQAHHLIYRIESDGDEEMRYTSRPDDKRLFLLNLDFHDTLNSVAMLDTRKKFTKCIDELKISTYLVQGQIVSEIGTQMVIGNLLSYQDETGERQYEFLLNKSELDEDWRPLGLPWEPEDVLKFERSIECGKQRSDDMLLLLADSKQQLADIREDLSNGVLNEVEAGQARLNLLSEFQQARTLIEKQEQDCIDRRRPKE